MGCGTGTGNNGKIMKWNSVTSTWYCSSEQYTDYCEATNNGVFIASTTPNPTTGSGQTVRVTRYSAKGYSFGRLKQISITATWNNGWPYNSPETGDSILGVIPTTGNCDLMPLADTPVTMQLNVDADPPTVNWGHTTEASGLISNDGTVWLTQYDDPWGARIQDGATITISVTYFGAQ